LNLPLLPRSIEGVACLALRAVQNFPRLVGTINLHCGFSVLDHRADGCVAGNAVQREGRDGRGVAFEIKVTESVGRVGAGDVAGCVLWRRGVRGLGTWEEEERGRGG